MFEKPFTKIIPKEKDILHSALVQLLTEKRNIDIESTSGHAFSAGNPWFIQDSFRVNYHSKRKLKFVDSEDNEYEVEIRYFGPNEFQVRLVSEDSDFVHFRTNLVKDNLIKIESDEQSLHLEFFIDKEGGVHTMRSDGDIVSLTLHSEDFSGEDAENLASMVVSPMPGKIVKIFTTPGESVKKGQQLLSLESMKMEYLIKAEKDGVIKDVHTAETEFVQIGAKLVEFEHE